MSKNGKFWNDTSFGYFTKHFLIASISVVGLLLLSMFLISIYTQHGKKVLLPDLKSMKTEEALHVLNEMGVKAEIIDSVFVKNRELGTIIEQNPAANSIVKPGRTVFLIVNSRAVRQISFPNMRDISLRQAQAVAHSVGFNISSIQYASSEYRDLVLDVTYKGRSIEIGEKIPEGSSIILVVGDGAGVSEVNGTPLLLGFDLATATDIIHKSGMYVGHLDFDIEPAGDENSYIVYEQTPGAYEFLGNDSLISLKLTKDMSRLRPTHTSESGSASDARPKKEGKTEKVKDIEDFF